LLSWWGRTSAMRPLTVLAAFVAVLLTSCGDSSDEPASPREQARQAAVEILRAKDPERLCATLVTDRLLQEVYLGDRGKCIENARSDEDPGKPRVGNVTVAGRRADVKLSVEGGAGDGVSGTVELARERGGWKLDRFGADYLRSTFDASIDQVSTGALSLPAMRACMSEQAASMPEPLLRRFIYRAFRGDRRASQTTIAVAERCPDALATFVAGEIVRVLTEEGDASPAFRRCAERKIRTQLRISGLASKVLKHNTSDAGTAALQGLTLGVANACRGVGGARMG
jgi:hypothetical protein